MSTSGPSWQDTVQEVPMLNMRLVSRLHLRQRPDKTLEFSWKKIPLSSTGWCGFFPRSQEVLWLLGGLGGRWPLFPKEDIGYWAGEGSRGKRNDQWLPAAQDNGGGGACSEQQLEANVGNPAPLSLKPRSFSVRSLFKKLAWPPIN